jgi:two-component system LytT family sensor kinase
MDGLHSLHLTGNVIAYSTAFLVSLLLLVLTLRAARLPGTPLANIAFASCAVLWTGGGLAHTALGASGFATFVPSALQYTAVLGVLISLLVTWGASGHLALVAAVGSAAFTVTVWSGAVPLTTLRPLIAYYAAAVLIVGVFSLRERRRAILVPSLTIVLAACAAAILATVRAGATVFFLLTHLIMFAVLCSFFLYARFRYADTFVRYGVRMVLAATLTASLLQLTEARVLAHVADQSHAASVHVFAMVFLANTVLLALTFLDDAISRRLIRWLFRAPDYEAETAKLADRVSRLQDESEIAAALEETSRRSLDLPFAAVEPAGGAPPLHVGELLVPIYSAGEARHNLRVVPGGNRPGLVSRDLLYLRDLATVCGNRLDALSREREAADRQSREALLLQQVTEAELRALRAQVNPHFLFNSLNTIADLTVRDPARAEAMTVRLASVFRHVLAHSARPLTTVRDELAFLRTYLYIEEVRFGERLQVSIEAAPEVESAPIPSLILQPLVENALKHGLGPKVGVGHLWIRAALDRADILLTVEDDGEGLRPTGDSQGVGLANISDRLRTLYGGRAAVTLERREEGGARATVRIPKDAR